MVRRYSQPQPHHIVLGLKRSNVQVIGTQYHTCMHCIPLLVQVKVIHTKELDPFGSLQLAFTAMSANLIPTTKVTTDIAKSKVLLYIFAVTGSRSFIQGINLCSEMGHCNQIFIAFLISAKLTNALLP